MIFGINHIKIIILPQINLKHYFIEVNQQTNNFDYKINVSWKSYRNLFNYLVIQILTELESFIQGSQTCHRNEMQLLNDLINGYL